MLKNSIAGYAARCSSQLCYNHSPCHYWRIPIKSHCKIHWIHRTIAVHWRYMKPAWRGGQIKQRCVVSASIPSSPWISHMSCVVSILNGLTYSIHGWICINNVYYIVLMYVILHAKLPQTTQPTCTRAFVLMLFKRVLTCHQGAQLIKRATVSVALAAVVKPREVLLTNC